MNIYDAIGVCERNRKMDGVMVDYLIDFTVISGFIDLRDFKIFYLILFFINNRTKSGTRIRS